MSKVPHTAGLTRCAIISWAILLAVLINTGSFSQTGIRTVISLDKGWTSVAADSLMPTFTGFEQPAFPDKNWKQVNIPHNWDGYEGYRRIRHGNRHGVAWYRKNFIVTSTNKGKRYFLFFEGVGSYATVWLNGAKVGYHAGGRTSFTIDVTGGVFTDGRKNLLAVRADHPAFIKDLPWVCGGCSDERGFSEGSQPMGIFRPVQLMITDETRIEPFGVHIWNDSSASTISAVLNIQTSIKNYSNAVQSLSVVNTVTGPGGKLVTATRSSQKLQPGSAITIDAQLPTIKNPRLWSLEDPYLYSVVSEIVRNGKTVDRVTIPYGIRTISWPVGKTASSNQFFLNGKPVFINGIAEYEHLLGQSHAFSEDQVKTRVTEVRAAGFNAFRDAHQPHNLRYQDYWDKLGILWWPQLSAHVWYDTPEFRNNFKSLLKEWVIERRNSPSVILWGLQNESKIPADFARECTDLIRELDPTTSSQRKVTTCNGGEGTDWDVPQNWTGTYGGNPATYGADVKRQVLIGEYGAWRTLDLHTEGSFSQEGALSEDRMTELMEMKLRQAEAAKDSTTGHFFWLLTSHDNPGRVQGGEGFRELDRIGPVNYKGLLTPWEEPLDVFYMFRSHHAPKQTSPMVYIVSHTWPDRWLEKGVKNGIVVYSNCDEVELFNDVNDHSLGRKKQGPPGTHFQWDNVEINYNMLYAVGYVKGKPVAKDYIVLNHLPKAPHFASLYQVPVALTAPKTGYNYIYRVNCGGPDYTDKNGDTWMADRQLSGTGTWGSSSWTQSFQGMPSYFASQRRTRDPIAGAYDWPLFQDFRYGRDHLRYEFPVPDGNYLVELYFIEPWLGTGGGMDCTGWRKFDVAVNDETVIRNLDIWKEAGHDRLLKKTVTARAKDGRLNIWFPNIASGQAVISAIAIATMNQQVKAGPPSKSLIENPGVPGKDGTTDWKPQTWLDTGERPFMDDNTTISSLPPALYGAEWISTRKTIKPGLKKEPTRFTVSAQADVYVAVDESIRMKPGWLNGYEDQGVFLETDENKGKKYRVYRKRFEKGALVYLGDNENNEAGNTSIIIAINPATSIEPAYDLKPSVAYRPAQAHIMGTGLVKNTVNDRESLSFTRSAGDTLEWTINVGAADRYSLVVRYYNPAKKALTGRMQILAADGTLMQETAVTFSTSITGKWSYLNGSTESMINAGSYLVRIISVDAEGLSVSGLDVQ